MRICFCLCFCFCFPVGARLLAMAAYQPTNPSRMYPTQTCGSWLACEGGPPANQSPPDAPSPNCGSWLACEDAQPANQSPPDVHHSKLWEREGGRPTVK